MTQIYYFQALLALAIRQVFYLCETIEVAGNWEFFQNFFAAMSGGMLEQASNLKENGGSKENKLWKAEQGVTEYWETE